MSNTNSASAPSTGGGGSGGSGGGGGRTGGGRGGGGGGRREEVVPTVAGGGRGGSSDNNNNNNNTVSSSRSNSNSNSSGGRGRIVIRGGGDSSRDNNNRGAGVSNATSSSSTVSSTAGRGSSGTEPQQSQQQGGRSGGRASATTSSSTGRSGGRGGGGRGNNRQGSSLQQQPQPSARTSSQTASAADTATASSSSSSTNSNSNNKPKSSSSHRNRNRGKQQQNPKVTPPTNESKQKEEEETKRRDEIRLATEKQQEEERQRVKRMEQQRLEEEAKKAAATAARELERQQRTTAIQDAIRIIQYTYDMAQYHATSRKLYQDMEMVKQIRHDFEIRKKSIKVDLKKCTTFIKKIKLGTYWNSSSSSTSTTGTATSTNPHHVGVVTQQQYQSMKHMMETITNDVASLNLSRYVEEVVAAILESCSISTTTTTTTTSGSSNNTSITTNTSTGGGDGGVNVANNKMSTSELSVIVALILAMHARYADFLSNLLPPLWNALLHHTESTGSSSSSNNKHHRRLYVRLFTELMMNGLLSNNDTQKFMKYVIEWTGGGNNNSNNSMKDSGNNNNSGNETTTPYVVQDAVAIVSFIRTAGFEVLGIVPTTLQNAMRIIRTEFDLHQTNNDAAIAMKQEGSASVPPTDDQPSETNPVMLDQTLLDNAMKFVDQLEPVLKDQRALPEATSVNLVKHCVGSYRAMSTTYIQTHQKMKKLEKRCEQDRLIAGQLTAQREKGFVDAQKLCDTLQKSVEVLSDCLQEPMPIIVSDDDTDGDRMASTGAGIEVWTKDNESNNENYGPFDDEETRSFYCDIPDLLATIPPALLGLNEEQLEKQKQLNTRKYTVGGSAGTGITVQLDETITPSTAEQLDAAEQGVIVLDDDDIERNNKESDNKDTPHYRLMTLLEQELPECNRREQLDEIAEKFATNHGSSKSSRKRLVKALFLVPRSRLDLLPFYSRLVTTLDHVYADLSTTLVTSLAQQFHGQAKFKKNQNIESRMRTARYLGELTKFRCAAPIVVLNCLALCNEDFTGYNVEIACCILESCGRFLFRTKHTSPRIIAMMETMTRLSKAKNLDERLQSLLKSAFYNVKPPQTSSRKTVKEYPPLEAYLRNLLLVRLEASESVTSMVSKQLVRMPWFDPSYQCAALVCKLLLKACRKGRYKTIEAVAAVAMKLRTQREAGEVPIRLTDAVLEELRWTLEQPNFRDQQRIITYTRLLGELHVTGLVPGSTIIDQLYEFINYGHLIPESLREASKEFVSKQMDTEQSDSSKLPVYNSAGTVSKVIQEDEEMEDEELITNVVEVEEGPKPIAVAPYSIFDPRVPSEKDSSTSTYRITLVCTLLETSARALITRNNLPRLKGFLAAFQRYLFTKTVLPTDVEFALLDTFDVVDSHWKRVSSGRGGGNSNYLDGGGFPRYNTWLEAHTATVAAEESDAAFQAKKCARLEALADESKLIPEMSITDDDESSLFRDDDESESSGDDDGEESLSVKSKDSGGVDVALDDDDGGNDMDVARDADVGHSMDSDDGDDDGVSDGSVDDEEEEDEDEEYYDEEEEDNEAEFDEEAYMMQLEEEAFERELRILTMEAIEKGKVQSRKQVDDSMISGSQIMKRKASDSSKFATSSTSYTTDSTPSTGVALSGDTGISFQVIKKGYKGKIELKELVVPVDTNLAVAATRHDDAAAKERDEIKQRVLRYEAQSEMSSSGGNVYLDQGRLERNRNRPLSMDVIDKNFGTSGGNLHPSQTEKKGTAATTTTTSGSTSAAAGRGNFLGGRGPSGNNPGRGGGRGGGRTNIGGRRLF